jgi:hypothetical protein
MFFRLKRITISDQEDLYVSVVCQRVIESDGLPIYQDCIHLRMRDAARFDDVLYRSLFAQTTFNGSTAGFRAKKKSRSPRKRSRTLNGFALIRDSRVGVSVLKGGRTRATLELVRSQRFIFAEITIDLPPVQVATGIHDFPAVAAKNFLKL